MTVLLDRVASDGPGPDMALLGGAAMLIGNDIADEGRDPFIARLDKEHVPETTGDDDRHPQAWTRSRPTKRRDSSKTATRS